MIHTSSSPRTGDLFFGVAVAFLFGVFAENMGWNVTILVGLSVTASICVALFFNGLRRYGKYLLLLAATVCAGALYYHAYLNWQTAHLRLPMAKNAAFFGTVTEEPKAAGNFIMIVASLSRPYAGAVDIFTMPNGTAVNYGDEIWIEGTITPSEDAGELPAVFLPRLRVVAEHEGFWLKEAVIDFKGVIGREIARFLSADEAALLSGIMLGTTATTSAVLKAQMDASGTTYIVNMYGYKLAIIALGLTAVLKDHLPRKVLSCVVLVATAFFIFASGGTTSAIRAGVMGSFAVVARGTGRMFNARNAVTFSALGMVLLNATILTDAGFQLSFLSFLGIYYLGPPINNYFHWIDGGALQWKEHAMLSLSTNLAILPIVMGTFGSFSLTSFISNILIMIPWLAVIAFGALLVIFGFISPPLAFCIAQVVSILLRYELFVIRLFSVIVMPMPSIFGSNIAIAFYYVALILFAHYYGARAS